MRLIFDEIFGPKWVLALRGIFDASRARPMPKILHVFDIGGRGIHDDKWVPKLGKEHFIVVSCDMGKHGPIRLPHVCEQHQKTLVLMAPKTHDLKMIHKARAILTVWPELEKA